MASVTSNTDEWNLTLLLSRHHRLSDSGNCVCGYQGILGDMFPAHIAHEIVQAGWVKQEEVRSESGFPPEPSA